MTILLCLCLLLVANGAPILVRWLPGIRHWNPPLDAHYHLADGQRLFGNHKTWRGLIAAVLLTAAAGWLLNLPLWLGALFGALSLLGDLLGSFIKRRRQLMPGAPAPGLDQLPEALLPLLILHQPLGLGWQEVLLVPPLFTLIALLVSRGLYRLRIRRRPW